MKVICSKADLFKGIQTVQNIISAKITLPILSHLLLETKGNQLRLVSTDLETGIACLIPAEVIESGGIAIPARTIGGVIRDLPDADVRLSVKKGVITINCQKGIFKIAGLEKDSFPELPQIKEGKSFTLRQDTLKEMLRKTSFAVSHDETRRALTGIFFIIKKGKLRLVATDGKRLVYIERKIDILPGVEREIILSFKASNEMSHLLGEGEKEVKIILGENQVAFHLNGTKLISRLIEGHFPEYRKVIPTKPKERISLIRKPFLLALKRVSVLTSKQSSSVRLDVSKDKLLLTATAPEVGDAREELDLDYEGGEISIAFNPIYMLDFLKNEEEEKVCLELTDALNPGLMRPVITDKERSREEKHLYVIMPMKL